MKRFTLLFNGCICDGIFRMRASHHADGHAYRNAFDGNGHANRGSDIHNRAANIDRLCRRVTNRRVW